MRRGEPSVLDQKLAIIRRIDAGDNERGLDLKLQGHDLHESVDGALEMWRIFDHLNNAELSRWLREARRRAHPQMSMTLAGV
jgi:hypothetical protein